MKTLKTFSLFLATALFMVLASCGGSSAPKEEAKEVVKEVEEVVEAPMADTTAVADSVEMVAADSVATEETASEETEM